MAGRKMKSFSSKKEKKAPIAFELEGEEFEAYGNVPGAVLLEFMEYAGSERAADTAKGILLYINKSLDEKNLERFNKLIHDPDVMIELETLSEIVSYLIEERGDSRPTEAS